MQNYWHAVMDSPIATDGMFLLKNPHKILHVNVYGPPIYVVLLASRGETSRLGSNIKMEFSPGYQYLFYSSRRCQV